MLPFIDCTTLLQYSPRGTSEISVRSREVRDAIKGGRISAEYQDRFAAIISENQEKLGAFLHTDVTLVPLPRSSPRRASDLWPSLEIANMLASLKLGTVAPCLIRQTAVKKSALYSKAADRPSVAEHYYSFLVEDAIPTKNITLIDDILTLGRTSIAAASRIAEKFPTVTIRLFALLQTKGRPTDGDIDRILQVEAGRINYSHKTGKSQHKSAG
jgi:hypothetical protein